MTGSFGQNSKDSLQFSMYFTGCFHKDSNKIISPKDLADSNNVDKRRKKIGLKPIENIMKKP